MMGRLRTLAGRFNCIGDVRGLGSMVAMELFKGGDRAVPDPDLARKLVAAAAEKGLILLSCGIFGNTIRVLVPLTASREIVDEGLDIIETCLGELSG
jgi:4-aminobutyrate aminotransferase-like enzyme